MSELTGYAPAAAQEGEDSYSYVNSVAAAENGDLLVSETVSMTVFELPRASPALRKNNTSTPTT